MSQQAANPGLIFLEKVRLSFPHLAAPHASAKGAVPKFSADFIMEPSHPAYAQFWALVQQKAQEVWKEQAPQVLQYINQDRKMRAYCSGEEVVDKTTMQPYIGYPGKVIIKGNNAIQPALFDANGTQLMDARKFYGGCYVNAQVQPWMQNNEHGRAVRCELVGIQFHSDGEPFGVAPVDPTTLFGAVAGAPQGLAPGVAGVAAAQAPGGYAPPPAQAPGGYAPPPAPAVGGYNPAAYPAPAGAAPAPANPAAPGAPLGVPGFLQ